MTIEQQITTNVTPRVCRGDHRPWQRQSAAHLVRIGVVPVCAIRLTELLQAFDEMLEQRNPSYACFCGAHLCVCAARDSRVRQALQEADFCLPDGVAATLGARLLGERLPERLPGPSVMLDICRHGLARGYRHFFYGGAEGIPDRLAEKLRERFPGLQVAGTYSPPFRELTVEEDEAVVERINRSDPDIVWVGLGAPKQELWAQSHRGRLSASLILTVGAAFDFNSGHKRRAPLWVRQMGFEWLFRMLTEGRPMFFRYARIVPMFTAMILKQAIWQVVSRSEGDGERFL
jgi:N-acetylglucosaminyldiphosphoundecaprenol N-acetyl-beta-D-mannosaminyltransferase